MAKGKVEILLEYCKGCGLCVAVCPTRNLRIADGLSALGVRPAEPCEATECTLCRRCAVVCPDGAIRLTRLDEEDLATEDKSETAETTAQGGDDG